MSLPKSIGKPGASPTQLLEESLALKAPYGVKTLVIRPEELEPDAGDPDILRVMLFEKLENFFSAAAGGDRAKSAELSDIFFSKEFGYIPERAAMAAADANYKDAHSASLQTSDGERLGIIIAQRGTCSYGDFAKLMTDLDGQQFSKPGVSFDQLRFMSHWHEAAHTTGADEAQADTMAAIVTRKAFPDGQALQVYADMRAIDALFDHANPNGRPERYGWKLVEAVDNVIHMSDNQIDAYDETKLRGITKQQFDNPKQEALCRVARILSQVAPELVTAGATDLNKTGVALKELLQHGVFDGDTDAKYVAKRSLQAITRLGTPTPALAADMGMTATQKVVASPSALSKNAGP